MSTPKKQLTLFVTFQVAPKDIEAWKAAHRPVWAACAAEPECLLFDVFEDPETPGRFRLVEVWSEGRDWFEQKQLTKPYYETLWEKSKPLWITDSEFETDLDTELLRLTPIAQSKWSISRGSVKAASTEMDTWLAGGNWSDAFGLNAVTS